MKIAPVKYYMGIDLGTNSCGWAVTDEDFHVVEKGGKHLWGIRLFDEAQSAAERRGHRTQRKRIMHAKWRIALLREIFKPLVDKVDSQFFYRLDNSFHYDWSKPDDPDHGAKTNTNPIFLEKDYGDREYYDEYPTIFHLRSKLVGLKTIGSKAVDPRLVYLAFHNLIKYRGNFLSDSKNAGTNATPEEIKDIFDSIDASLSALSSQGEDQDDSIPVKLFSCTIDQAQKIKAFFGDKGKGGISASKEALSQILGVPSSDKQKYAIISFISGGKCQMENVFQDQGLKDSPIEKKSMDDWETGIEPQLGDLPADQANVLIQARKLYDAHMLSLIIGDNDYLCEAMVERYDDHKKQLAIFKKLVKQYYPNAYYDSMFRLAEDKKKKEDEEGEDDEKTKKTDVNYVRYVGFVSSRGKKENTSHGERIDFYKYVSKSLDLANQLGDCDALVPDWKEKKAEQKNLDSLDGLYQATKDPSFFNGPDSDLHKAILLHWLKDSMDNNQFLLKMRSKDNGVIPNQLNRKELVTIIANLKSLYPDWKAFFETKDGDGYSNESKIVSIFDYHIPYYVGPLDNNERNANSWAREVSEKAGKKAVGKVYPWNWEKFVDKTAAADEFVNRMLNRCTYLLDEPTLPRNSLLFSEYTVLNLINTFALEDQKTAEIIPLNQEQKDLLLEKYKEIGLPGVKRLQQFAKDLTGKQEMKMVYQTGKDIKAEELQANARPFVDFKKIFGHVDGSNWAEIEDIIRDVTVFEDKGMLEERLKGQHPDLTLKQLDQIVNGLNYSGWAPFSAELLDSMDGKKIVGTDPDGQKVTIIKAMRKVYADSNGHPVSYTFMQLINDERFGFDKAIQDFNAQFADSGKYKGYRDYIGRKFASPIMKRAVIQAMDVITEAQKILGHPIDCFFLEATRAPDEKKKGQNGNKLNRYFFLADQYKRLGKQISTTLPFNDKGLDKVRGELEGLKRQNKATMLRSRKLFLYFMQMGKDLYTGEEIDIHELLENDDKYDLDHIIPRSKVKDDSIDNMVLVAKYKNNEKADSYPIPKAIIEPKGWAVIEALHKLGLMSQEKYHRLTRDNSLSDEELLSFVNRQLTSTSQSVKALRDVIETHYKETLIAKHEYQPDYESYRKDGYEKDMPKVLFPKAVNTSEFRKKFDIFKCREVNDFHHAHDAYLNIVVGDCYYESFGKVLNIERMKQLKAEFNATFNTNKIFEHPIKRNFKDGYGSIHVWNPVHTGTNEGTIKVIRREISHKDIILTYRMRRQGGGLFDQTIYSPRTIKKKNISSYIPLKSSDKDRRLVELSDIRKYGYYNKATAKYLSLVESDGKKGKKVYSIEPVPAYVAKFDEDYLKSQGLKNPKIILPKLLINTVCEATDPDNPKAVSRFMITGKTGNSYVITNLKEAFYPDYLVFYCKLLAKYNDIINKASKDGSDTMRFYTEGEDIILKRPSEDKDKPQVMSVEKPTYEGPQIINKVWNLYLYDYITKQIQKPIYWFYGSYKKFAKAFEDSRDKFQTLGVVDQVKLLSNALALTECKHNGGCDLGLIGGSSKSGALKINKTLSGPFKILTQSYTGYYEKVIFELDKDGNRVK